MLKGIMKKISIATNVFLVLQLVFLGAGSAYASTPAAVTNLSVIPSIGEGSSIQGLNTEFDFGVNVQGMVYTDVEENDARIFGVVKEVTDPSSPVVVDPTNIKIDGAEILSETDEQKILIDSDDLVIAFGGDNGFSIDSKKDEIEGTGYSENGKLAFAKKGKYNISYYVYAGPDLDDTEEGFVKIGSSATPQAITIEETALEITGTTLEDTYGITELFDNTVTIEGNLYDDVSNDESKLYTVITRKDKTNIDAADITIDGDSADQFEASEEEIEDLGVISTEALVLGYPENAEDYSSEKEEIKEGLEIIFEGVKISKGGVYEIGYILLDTDKSLVIGKSIKTQVITIDGTAPKATLSTKYVNSKSPLLSGTIDDPKATVWVTVDGEDIGGEAVVSGGVWSIEIADVLAEGEHEVVLDTEDIYGNTASYTEKLTIDTKAPNSVTSLTAKYSDTSKAVILSWINPDAATFDLIEIVRKSGPETVTFTPGKVNYFEDGTVLRGKSYSYQVIVVDAAGNKTSSIPVYISVPAAKVVVAYSTSLYSTTGSEVTAASDGTTTDVTGEVKSDSTSDTTTTTASEDKTSDEKEFPTWGIIALIFLLALGGYLFWVQKPEEDEPIVTVEKKGGNGNSKNKR